MGRGNEKELCLALMKADTEDEVIELLSDSGYWDNPEAWRDLGDEDNNQAIIGNQQRWSDRALVEKLVNSIDARLMDECLKKGIKVDSSDAPPNIRQAVAQFIEKNPNPERVRSGKIKYWDNSLRLKISREITLAATGSRRKPSFSIADGGEGQTPKVAPKTLLSIIKGNSIKRNIPFVQGKFNMGGTGVLRFCGKKKLQLVVTRRDPKLLGKNPDPTDRMWSFTIVRKDNPEGNERFSVYRYLAPLGSNKNPRKGDLLWFEAEKFPIFPKMNKAYEEFTAWGTLIKLYEYSAKGFSSHILMPDGLFYRMNLLLPDPALPIRFHECRNFAGKEKGSFETTLTGITVRLSDNRAESQEPISPFSLPFNISGEKIICTVYVFKKGRASTYRKKEGLIFTYNGQAHHIRGTNFFRGKKVGLSFLANSLLVILDCSQISKVAFEDLFMNNRDSVSEDSELKREILETLVEELKSHEGLREIKNIRQEEEMNEKWEESKPFEEVLESVFKNSPALSKIFLKGTKLSNVFKSKKVKSVDIPYVGKQFPTYFDFKGKPKDYVLERECHINYRCRIQFETDVNNDYFSRDVQPGTISLDLLSEDVEVPMLTFSGPRLSNGLATLTFPLPNNSEIGQVYSFKIKITDETQVDPFENIVKVRINPPAEKNGVPGKRSKPPSDESGDDRDRPLGINFPKWVWVKEEKWENQDPPFDKFTAVRVTSSYASDDNDLNEENLEYNFKINADNIFLKTELKFNPHKEANIKEQFKFGMILTGLALIHDNQKYGGNESGEENDDEKLEELIENIGRALAPFIVPMIETLGNVEHATELIDEDF